MAVVDIATEAVSAFIRQRKNKVMHKALLTMRRQLNFQVNREIGDAINHLYNII